MTLDRILNHVRYSTAKPEEVSPERWHGILRALFVHYRNGLPKTIRIQCYGGGFRWYCNRCDVLENRIFWTNSSPPKICKCGGIA